MASDRRRLKPPHPTNHEQEAKLIEMARHGASGQHEDPRLASPRPPGTRPGTAATVHGPVAPPTDGRFEQVQVDL